MRKIARILSLSIVGVENGTTIMDIVVKLDITDQDITPGDKYTDSFDNIFVAIDSTTLTIEGYNVSRLKLPTTINKI